MPVKTGSEDICGLSLGGVNGGTGFQPVHSEMTGKMPVLTEQSHKQRDCFTALAMTNSRKVSSLNPYLHSSQAAGHGLGVSGQFHVSAAVDCASVPFAFGFNRAFPINETRETPGGQLLVPN